MEFLGLDENRVRQLGNSLGEDCDLGSVKKEKGKKKKDKGP